MGTQNFTLKLVAMALALSGGVLIAQTPRSESLSEVARSLEKRRSWVEWAFQERLDSLDREARLLDSRSSELFPWSVDFYLGSEIPAEPLRRRVNAPSGKLDEVALWTSAQKSLQVWMDSAGGRPSWGPQLRVILPIQAQSGSIRGSVSPAGNSSPGSRAVGSNELVESSCRIFGYPPPS